VSAASNRVSVVTPFFNEAGYLPECIESVLGQTHGDFEYILVDNHSSDGSSELARGYERKDSRIRVVRPPEHLGQLPNHDFGLRAISDDSAYCKVVQGDDWLFPSCLELLVARAQEHPSAGLVSGFTMLESAVYLTGLHPSQTLVPGREIGRRFLSEGLYVFGGPTAHLFRAELVRARHPFYDESAHPFADVDSCLNAVTEMDFAFVHQVLSFSRRSNESITTQRTRFLNTMLLTRYVMLLRHGPTFFSASELAGCRQRLESEYYRSLGESFWRLLPREFWVLQRDCLESAGAGFSRGRTLGAIGAELLRMLANPLESGQRVAARLRDRRGAAT
jgi:glycosyltransferase involved in cell wall biosynthesis